MRAGLIYLIALGASLLTTFSIVEARPQQFSRPNWNQNPNNSWNLSNDNIRITANTSTTPSTGTPTATTASPRFLACMQRCQSTMEYNPVCGSDNISYYNEGRLRCALMCGKNVATTRQGTCQPM